MNLLLVVRRPGGINARKKTPALFPMDIMAKKKKSKMWVGNKMCI